MGYEQNEKLKRGDMRIFREVCRLELRRFWFICHCIAGDTEQAAPLLLDAWKKASEKVVTAAQTPEERFGMLVAAEVFQAAADGLSADPAYSALTAPAVSEQYAVFVAAIERMAYAERYIYLLHTFGGLSISAVAALLDIPFEQAKQLLADLAVQAQSGPEIKKLGLRDAMYLSTQFKSPDGQAFLRIAVPQPVCAALEQDYRTLLLENGKKPRKDKIRKEKTRKAKKRAERPAS